jgi:hypothetical protein
MKDLLLILYILSFGVLLISCGGKNDVNHEQVNYGNNIVVLTDLSNRILRNKAVHDTTIIFSIIDRLKPMVEKSIDLGVEDKFKFYSVNQSAVNKISLPNKVDFDIDLTEFNGNELARSNYLYGRVDHNYGNDIKNIKKSIAELYKYSLHNKTLGADVWHYFKNDLNSVIIDTTSSKRYFRKNTYITKRKNKIILLTDGYIEAGRYANDPTMTDKNNPKKTKYLSWKLLEQFRENFNRSNYVDIAEFFKAEEYGIVPVNNPLLPEVQFLILEIDDRTIINGVTTTSPTDSEIIKLYWKDWLIKSGVDEKNIQIHDIVKNEKELDQILSNFLNK